MESRASRPAARISRESRDCVSRLQQEPKAMPPQIRIGITMYRYL
jgi:hypothetical protein